MNKAIITGATGLIASGVVEYLLENDIEVLALGRRDIKDSRISHLQDHVGLKYLQLEMAEINQLPELLKSSSWETGEACVFYHFAWSGDARLHDGSIDDQFKNVGFAADAVVVAKALGCIKFINAGSQEERFVDTYLSSFWKERKYHSNMGTYGAAKVSTRDMCLLLSYINKIDYIHTRVSTIFDESLEANNYINTTLKKIQAGEAVEAPQNSQLFDFISKEECAQAYYELGQKGKNKGDYFLGSGKPMGLREFFNDFSLQTKGVAMSFSPIDENDRVLTEADFDNSSLRTDTQFSPSTPSFKSINQ